MRVCLSCPSDEPSRLRAFVFAARFPLWSDGRLTRSSSSTLADLAICVCNCRTERVHKRQSNVMKLAEQNEKLKEELRAMTERLEAAERRQKDLEARAQQRRSGESAH